MNILAQLDAAFWTSLVGKAPELVALILLVWMFLKAMRERDVLLSRLHDEHLSARADSRKVIEDNVGATRDNTQALQALRDSIASCSGPASGDETTLTRTKRQAKQA